uniref:NADH dehydrogenase [ubiquinone] 1 beta subcomplex subunit 6 n=1 Tax=Lygus hesperus TaxID=30085 RepID=A0A0A9ZHC0_LYGHE
MASTTGGVKAFSIQGRLCRERERLHGSGMTPAERAWRAQWIKDQRLAPHEPVHVPEIQNHLVNPIRRFYRAPMDKFEKLLVPHLGVGGATMVRYMTAKVAIIIGAVYVGAYYFKYNANDWTRKGGWRVVPNRKSVVPGDPGYPYKPEKLVGSDYADRGFKNSPI